MAGNHARVTADALVEVDRFAPYVGVRSIGLFVDLTRTLGQVEQGVVHVERFWPRGAVNRILRVTF